VGGVLQERRDTGLRVVGLTLRQSSVSAGIHKCHSHYHAERNSVNCNWRFVADERPRWPGLCKTETNERAKRPEPQAAIASLPHPGMTLFGCAA